MAMIWLHRAQTCHPPLARAHQFRSFTLNQRLQFPHFSRTLRNAYSPKNAVPSFREHVARTSPVKSFADSVKYPGVLKHIFFALGSSALVYGIAAQNTNSVTDIYTRYFRQVTQESIVGAIQRSPNSAEMHYVRDVLLVKKVQKQVDNLGEFVSSLPALMKQVVVYTYASLGQTYVSSSEGRRAGWALCAVNVAVWAAWQIPRLRPFMHMHFAHNPLSGKTYTMFTSIFSHASIIHLVFNCMALTSFASAAGNWMGHEQRSTSELQEATEIYHFYAFFISAGLFSSLVSHVVSARFRFPRLVAQLARKPPSEATARTSAAATLTSSLTSVAKTPPPVTGAVAAAEAATPAAAILPSLGASGAVYASVILSALAFPNAEVSLVFPPTGSIPIGYGVGGLLLLDCVGALRGWRIMDHYAHLGGAAFGALYYAYGMQAWDATRVRLMGATQQLKKWSSIERPGGEGGNRTGA